MSSVLGDSILTRKNEYVYVNLALAVEVSYQETTESQRYGVGFTMKRPVFRRFRADKKTN